MFFTWIFLLLLLYLLQSTALNPYCKLSKMNSPCKNNCQAGPKCETHYPSNLTYVALQNAHRRYIVRTHNQMRNMFARSMRPDHMVVMPYNVLSYDFECEYLAACYIKQCRYQPDPYIVALNGDRVKMNVYREQDVNIEENISLQDLLRNGMFHWFSKNKLVNKTYLFMDHHLVRRQGVIPFWQMVWPKTKYVGCAYLQTFGKMKRNLLYFYCNYKPALDLDILYDFVQGKYVPEVVESCKQNNEYLALCGDIRLIHDDLFKAPSKATQDPQTRLICFIGLLLRLVM